MAWTIFFLSVLSFSRTLCPCPQNLFNYWLHNLHICRLALQPRNDTPRGSTARQPDATHHKACGAKCHRVSRWKESCSDHPLYSRLTLHLTHLPTSNHALTGSRICTSVLQVNACVFYVTDFYLDNLLRSLPTSATLWSYECYWKKGCTSSAPWSFLMFMTNYMCSSHRVTMEMHSLGHRKQMFAPMYNWPI